MKFKESKEKTNFLKDRAYYISPDNFCLGSEMKSAGKIFKKILCDKEQQEVKDEIKGNNTAMGMADK